MNNVCKTFALFAALGFVLSLVTHVYNVLGLTGPLGDDSNILSSGGMVAVILVGLAYHYTWVRGSPLDFWWVAPGARRPWMRYLTYGFGAYVVLNSLPLLLYPPSRGTPYSVQHLATSRVMSLYSMVWYGAACNVLYLKSQSPVKTSPTSCKNGHAVAALSTHCETCGAPIESSSGGTKSV